MQVWLIAPVVDIHVVHGAFACLDHQCRKVEHPQCTLTDFSLFTRLHTVLGLQIRNPLTCKERDEAEHGNLIPRPLHERQEVGKHQNRALLHRAIFARKVNPNFL